MSLADYQIVLVDWNGQSPRVYDGAGIYELRYSRALDDVGQLALVVPNEPALSTEVFKLDYLIEVQRRSPVSGLLVVEDTYFTRLMHRFRDGDEDRFVAGGLSLNHLLMRRIVDPDDDPLQSGGYSTKLGAADDVLFAYAREQCGDLASSDRRFPNFSVAGTYSVGKTVGQRLRHENLLEVFQNVAAIGACDFTVRRVTGNTLSLDIFPIGANKSKSSNYPGNPFVYLTTARGNLSDPSLETDRKGEKNFIYLKGQGQGKKRKLLKVPGSTINDSPYNRIEFSGDARNADKADATTLLTDARAQLNKTRPDRQFSFDPTGAEPGNVYRLDWDLGDIVTVAWDDDEFDLRITGVEITINGEGERMKVTVETLNE